MSPRGALLTAASAAGLLLARGLDGLGVLPGVTESAAVRHAALDPRWTALGLLACVGVGHLAALLLRRHALLAVGALVLGQVGVVVALEEAARALSGAPEGGGENGLWVAAAGQVALALLAVTTAVLVLQLAPAAVEPGVRLPGRLRPLPSYRVVLVHAVAGVARGRAPPRGC